MRLFALTVAAMLGTGCIVHNDNNGRGDVDLFWDFLRTAPAQVDGFVIYDDSLGAVNVGGVCPQSDVDTVRVTSAAGTIDVACTGPVGGGQYSQGLTIHSLPAGANTVTITGFRGGTAVYRSSPIVNVLANQTVTRIVDVVGIPADLDIFGYLAFGDPPDSYLTCGEAGSPDIGFRIWDSFGTLVDQGLTDCIGVLPLLTFAGTAELDNYTLRMQGFRTSDNALVFDSCNVPFDHFGPQVGVGGVTTTLFTRPVPACP